MFNVDDSKSMWTASNTSNLTNNTANHNGSGSAALFDFNNNPNSQQIYRSTSIDFTSLFNQPQSLYEINSAPQAQSTNYPLSQLTEQPVYRGIAVGPTLAMPSMFQSQQSNNHYSFNANQDYWGSIPAATAKKSELTLSNNLEQLAITVASPAINNTTNIVLDEPIYVERYSSFYSIIAIKICISEIDSLLELNNIDYTYNPLKSKFKCAAYDQYQNTVQFIIKLYKAKLNNNNNNNNNGGEQRLVIEFQRRSGCSVAFNRLYQQLYNQLKSTIIQCPYNNTSCIPNTLLSIIVPEPIASIDSHSLQSLCLMSRSGDIISAREAGRLLSIAKNLNNTESAENIDLIIDMLQSVLSNQLIDSIQQRYTALIIDRLTDSELLRPIVIKKLLNSMIKSLDCPLSTGIGGDNNKSTILQSRSTKRSIASALAHCTLSQSKLLSKSINTEQLAILNKYSNVADQRVAGQIQTVLKAITV